MDWEECDFLTCQFRHVFDETVSDLGVNSETLDQRIRENNRARIGSLAFVKRQIDNEIVVVVAILLVERSARTFHRLGCARQLHCA